MRQYFIYLHFFIIFFIAFYAHAESTKDYDFVYEKCTKQPWANQVDCECVTKKVLELHLNKQTEEPIDVRLASYFTTVSQRTACYNVAEVIRQQNDLCMGMPFKRRISKRAGVTEEEYCECLAQTYGKLFREFKGRMNSNERSSLRSKAMNHCKRPKSYK